MGYRLNVALLAVIVLGQLHSKGEVLQRQRQMMSDGGKTEEKEKKLTFWRASSLRLISTFRAVLTLSEYLSAKVFLEAAIFSVSVNTRRKAWAQVLNKQTNKQNTIHQ